MALKIALLDQYQEEAKKTINPSLLKDKKELQNYLCLKLAEESGEVISIVAKHYYHGKVFNRDDFKAELGDLFFYLSNLAESEGFSLSEVASSNIKKLRERHGDSYKASYYKGK